MNRTPCNDITGGYAVATCKFNTTTSASLYFGDNWGLSGYLGEIWGSFQPYFTSITTSSNIGVLYIDMKGIQLCIVPSGSCFLLNVISNLNTENQELLVLFFRFFRNVTKSQKSAEPQQNTYSNHAKQRFHCN